ncbi:hypothetical protein U27_06751 [Candidatus Vecturithrix granuli]|uniref:Uncharacterized protein n=1 Tax=Vecturithrix granuli TaxID=1499967 RepID=A0A081C5B1_VECG1|nr:hypothetical protein U27_06751 [Candidatus Vecturithrix granuli]
MHPVDGRAALDYSDGRGRGEGVINAALEETVGIVALPDGTWRSRYRVDGHWWQIVVRSQGQTCHYKGPLGGSGWRAGLLDSAHGAPGVLSARLSGDSPGDPDRDSQSDPDRAPPPTPTCGGVAFEGFCWYLSEVVGDTCQAICEAEGLAVDTAVDTGGNFWDVHDAASCRSLLIVLHHPTVEPSSTILSLTSEYGLCGAAMTGTVTRFDGGQHATTQVFNNAQVACPCQ